MNHSFIFIFFFAQIREVAKHIEFQWSNVLSEQDKQSWEPTSRKPNPDRFNKKRKMKEKNIVSYSGTNNTTTATINTTTAATPSPTTNATFSATVTATSTTTTNTNTTTAPTSIVIQNEKAFKQQQNNNNYEEDKSPSSNTEKKVKRSSVTTAPSRGDVEFLKPKRPMTAYLFFAQEMRPKIKSLHPEYSGLTVTKELGKLWAGLSVMLKLKYKQLEEKARNEYLREVRLWQKRYHPDDYLALEEARQMHSDIAREKKTKKNQIEKKTGRRRK